MLGMRAVTIINLVLLLITNSGLVRTEEEAQALLRKVSETYKNLKSYYFESVMVAGIRIGEMQQKVEMPVVIAGIKPDMVRVELKSPLMDMVVVSDGQTTWVYRPRLNQYTKKAAVAVRTPFGGSMSAGGLDFGLLGSLFANQVSSKYEQIADRVKWAKILHDEIVKVGGQSISCYVVEVQYEPLAQSTDVQIDPSPQTFWIDKARHLVLRESLSLKMSKANAKSVSLQVEQTATLTVAKVDESLPKQLFVFTPPEGAQAVENMSLLGMKGVGLSGTEAADFFMKDLEGREFSLGRLRGKVVLLNFWATWCGPCRAELPHIEKLHRKLKDKGLVVLGVNNEAPETVRAFVRKNNYTFSTLVDAGGELDRKYHVEAIPTVVLIGKDGKIVTHHIGLQSEDDLRAALRQVGIEESK